MLTTCVNCYFSQVQFGLFTEGSIIGQASETYQTLFHAGGIIGACSNEAYNYVKNYYEQQLTNYALEKLGQKAKKLIMWGYNLVYLLAESAFSAFSIPNPMDITIYNVVADNSSYLTVFEGFDSDVTISDIIEKVNQN